MIFQTGLVLFVMMLLVVLAAFAATHPRQSFLAFVLITFACLLMGYYYQI